jgi:glycosyltransferase involved in cell wall biosynthesis
MNALTKGDPMDDMILDRIMDEPKLPRQPEVFVTITVPNEFQPVGKYNIGITAGIETTACAHEWIEGMNKMDLILTISEHSKKVLQVTGYEAKDQAGNLQKRIKLEKPIEVLHNCVHTDIFRKIPPSELEPTVVELMDQVKENFCFLFVGHWLQGDIGADRKDIGMLIRTFLEAFRRSPKKNRPALIIKTSGAGFSVLDREDLLKKIEIVRSQIPATNLPSVYLLHGDLSREEMNSLYNHPKVKTHVTFTKGEGFGRPLLEACMSEKPIVASGWSGHLDFLTTDGAVLLGGELQPVHPSSVWKGVIVEQSKWFQVDYNTAAAILVHMWKNYGEFRNRGVGMAKENAKRFNFEAIQQRTAELMDQYLPDFGVIPEAKELNLPTLKKIKPKIKNKADLPQLEEKKATMEAPVGAVGEAKTAQVPDEVGVNG